MTSERKDIWPLVVVIGAVFALLNLMELAFRDSGWPQVVGLGLGVALIALGVARARGWSGVRG